jgi:hypothetical protein
MGKKAEDKNLHPIEVFPVEFQRQCYTGCGLHTSACYKYQQKWNVYINFWKPNTRTVMAAGHASWHF